ncbi:hypothetical protein B0H34DRAFT_49648 [Crassisporium funariophilum]|nr:hypothetical protein B0H34DRAFT_49648 [Crassisporium funariophilum]
MSESAESSGELPDGAADKRRLAKNERERDWGRRLREDGDRPKASASPATKPPKSRSSKPKESDVTPPTMHLGPSSPTPPPEHTRIAKGHRFMYSDPERNYAAQYAKIRLGRDFTISDNALAKALFKKMPHHSLGSWRTYISQLARPEMDELRKRAGIEYRKAQSQRQCQPLETPSQQIISDAEEPPSTTATDSPAVVDSVGANQSDVEADLKIIAQFFAEEGNDDESQEESVIWGRLTAQTQCKTAASWEEFYNDHHEEVVRRYERLLSTQ